MSSGAVAACEEVGEATKRRKKVFFVIRDLSFPASQRALAQKGCHRICEEKAKAWLNISDGALFGWLMKRRGMFIRGHSGHFTKFIESVGICSSQLNVTRTSRLLPDQLGY